MLEGRPAMRRHSASNRRLSLTTRIMQRLKVEWFKPLGSPEGLPLVCFAVCDELGVKTPPSSSHYGTRLDCGLVPAPSVQHAGLLPSGFDHPLSPLTATQGLGTSKRFVVELRGLLGPCEELVARGGAAIAACPALQPPILD